MSKTKLKLVGGTATAPPPAKPTPRAKAARKGPAPAYPTLALWQAPSGALALTIDGDVAWRSEPSDESGWQVLSTDTEQITEVLQSTGIFDVLVAALGHRMANAPGGMAERRRREWIIKAYDRQHRGEDW